MHIWFLISFLQSWLITVFVTRLTRRVPLVEQVLLTPPEHLSSPTAFSGVRITRSLVLCVHFADRCLSFCTFSFGHCVVCSSVFWPLCCLFFCLLAIVLYVLLHIQILIIPLVSSNSSSNKHMVSFLEFILQSLRLKCLDKQLIIYLYYKTWYIQC